MTALEFSRISSTLDQSAGDYQPLLPIMPPMSINNMDHSLNLTNQMPLDLATEQVTAQNFPWDADEYLSSEYFSNTSSSPELADHAQACYPVDYQPNSTTPPNHDINMISPTEHPSLMERQIRSSTQMLQVPQMTEIQLRAASQKPKNRRYKVTSNTPAHVRECHHLAEKQYRIRLKAQFESLLAVLPASRTNTLADRDSSPSSGQVLSRGQVLDLARERILELEEDIRIMGSIISNGYPLA